ncbi:MAG: septum site-determining protein MinC [Cyanobacteria bacterium]|nr:septum site-determining protein MinC [Cyanobacteriota bacterium]
MAAVLIPALAPQQSHELRLPAEADGASALQEVAYALGAQKLQGTLLLDAGDWLLLIPELRSLRQQLQRQNLALIRVRAQRPETLVAASALGLETEATAAAAAATARLDTGTAPDPGLTIHRGTLRSGDHLQSEGTVLLLGDVNPGARISAAGHVLVWGRLRGVAHAGAQGDRSARIVALHLRPLQLRIANAVARGPADPPADGQAEAAHLVDGEIRIDPAPPSWPLTE